MVCGRKRFHSLVGAALVVVLGITAALAALAAQAAPQTPVSVFIKAEHLDGIRPDGGPVTIRMNVDMYGNDASALAGTGTVKSTTGGHVQWSLTGSMTGDVVTLTGVSTDANNPVLIGLTGSIVANAATGMTTFTYTFPSGPFAGESGTVHGEAKVAIRINS